MILSYKIHSVSPYINWIYFFHAWGFQPRFAAIANIHGCDSCRAMWLTTFPEEERSKASEAMQLFKEANRMLDSLDQDYEVKTIFKLCKANSDGDNLLIEKGKDQFITFPLLRQQTPKRDGSPFVCLSDFIRPLSSGIPDTIGAFASSIDADMEGLYEQDPYK
ncbi:MAG: 5-methyltetrahydrofolate--homocysteine methyltransferase, partial [Bacteroides acidifaciens]|nr:5-methyltetrahydrofolate--homocysteine methyltransferase [Bacteroides acidifaciens]